jgi:hypothetical protein
VDGPIRIEPVPDEQRREADAEPLCNEGQVVALAHHVKLPLPIGKVLRRKRFKSFGKR